MNWSKRQLVLVFLLPVCFCAESQEIKEKQSLQSVLKILEARFNITFTYVDENIEGISIVIPSAQFNLDEALEYLHLNTGLNFEQLNERFIAIQKKLPPKTIDICGILIDSETREKISEASIRAETTYAITNETGLFQLTDVPEKSILTIKSLGYRSVTIPAKKFQTLPCQTYQLNPQPVTLPELIIADYLTEGITKQTEGSFQIIPKNLGILPGLIEPDVLQTIQALPGIQSIDETISNINVRGGTNDQNLVLWDGIKMYQTGHFFGLISAFNPYLTQNISLIKNGTSSFLNDGVSSTIDIHSIDTLARKLSGGMGLNMINGDFFLRIPLSSKLSLQLSSRRSIADIVKTPTYDQYFSRAFRDTDVTGNDISGKDTVTTAKKNFYFYDVNFKLLYDITNRDKLRINFLKVNNEITYQENLQGSTIIESKTSSLSQVSNAVGVSYSRLLSERLRMIAEGYLSHYQLDATNFDIFNDQRLQQKNEVIDWGAKLGVLLSINKRIDLFTGYQFFEVGVSNSEDINNPPFSQFTKRVVHTHAAFAEGNYTSRSNATNLRTGIRINYIPEFEKILIEPRLAFSQRLGEALTLEMLGEIKSQTTTQIIDYQNDFLGVEKRKWILSDNEEIPVATSRQISTGVIFNWNGLLVSLEGYLKKINGITTSSQGFQNQFQFVRSSGNYFTKGIDFIINKKLNRISTWLSYSLARNDFRFNELVPSMFPNNLDIRHNASVGASYTSSRIQVSTGLRWHTGKPFTKPDETRPVTGNTINYQSPNSSRLNDYLRIDLSVKYNFHLSHSIKAQVGGSIWNLTDKTNVVDQYYRLNDKELQAYQQKALGLTPNLTFRIEF